MKSKLFMFSLVFGLIYSDTFAQYWLQSEPNLIGNSNLGYIISFDSSGTVMAYFHGSYLSTSTNSTGQVKVLKFNGNTWNQLGNTLEGDSETDTFGDRIKLSGDGNTLIVRGNPNESTSTVFRGQVQIFRFNGSSWEQKGEKFVGFNNDQAGYDISINHDGSVIAYSSPYNSFIGSIAGKVRILKWVSNGWIQVGNTIYGAAAMDLFGTSISLSGDGKTIAIGAHCHTHDGLAYAGQVRVFELNNNTWTLVGTELNGTNANCIFGKSVSINFDGTILAVGAPGYSSGTGSPTGKVSVFQRIGSDWTPLGLDILGLNYYEECGKPIYLSQDGHRLILGAIGNDDAAPQAGQTRLYGFNGAEWVQMGDGINGIQENDYAPSAFASNGDCTLLAIGDNAGSIKSYRWIAHIIADHPESTVACIGNDAGFTVNLSDQNAQLKWQINQGAGFSDLQDTGQYSGAFTNHLSIINIQAHNYTEEYRCLAHFSTYSDTSAVVSLQTTGEVLTNPENQQSMTSDSVLFVVKHSDEFANYQWQADEGNGFFNLSDNTQYFGTNSDSLRIRNIILSQDGSLYRCIINSCNQSDTTLFAELSVCGRIEIHPENMSSYIDSTVELICGSSDIFAFYQWQRDVGSGFENLVDGIYYGGTNDDTLKIILNETTVNHEAYRCVSTSGNCVDTSIVVYLQNLLVPLNQGDRKIMIYPNPASEELILEALEINSRVGFYTLEGELILNLQAEKSKIVIPVSGLESGIYVIRVCTQNSGFSRRVAILR